jgi:hypothetical protein
MYELQERSEILFIMDVELTMDLHIHGVSLNQLHNLLHFRIFSGSRGFLRLWFLKERGFSMSFQRGLGWWDRVGLASKAPSGLGLGEFTFFVKSVKDCLVHEFIRDTQITSKDGGSIVAWTFFSLKRSELLWSLRWTYNWVTLNRIKLLKQRLWHFKPRKVSLSHFNTVCFTVNYSKLVIFDRHGIGWYYVYYELFPTNFIIL